MAVFLIGAGIAPNLGKKASDYEVGSSVFIPVSGVNTEFLVVHQGNPDTNIYSTTCAGTWLLMKDCYTNATYGSNNDFETSSVFETLSTAFWNRLSNEAQGAIKTVKIPYTKRGRISPETSARTGENGLDCRVFLLSGYEVGLTDSDYFPANEGTKLDYFDSGTAEVAKTKRIAYMDGAVKEWLLRTPNIQGNDVSCTVTTTGNKNASRIVTSAYGARPAFILKPNTKFDQNTNIIIA